MVPHEFFITLYLLGVEHLLWDWGQLETFHKLIYLLSYISGFSASEFHSLSFCVTTDGFPFQCNSFFTIQSNLCIEKLWNRNTGNKWMRTAAAVGFLLFKTLRPIRCICEEIRHFVLRCGVGEGRKKPQQTFPDCQSSLLIPQ